MFSRATDVEELVAQAVTLFTRDTVFGAMGVMQEHRLGRVAVVSERDGELVGDLRVEDLYRAWAKDPLMTVGDLVRTLDGAGARPGTSGSA